jgi:hypothetical protein
MEVSHSRSHYFVGLQGPIKRRFVLVLMFCILIILLVQIHSELYLYMVFILINMVQTMCVVFLAVGMFSASKVLEVDITHQSNVVGNGDARLAFRHHTSWKRIKSDYVMQQIISFKGIGSSFLVEIVPRFQVFWSLQPDEGNLNSKRSSAALIKKAEDTTANDEGSHESSGGGGTTSMKPWKELTPELRYVSGYLQHRKEDKGRVKWHTCLFSYFIQSKRLVVKSKNSKKVIGEFAVNSAW